MSISDFPKRWQRRLGMCALVPFLPVVLAYVSVKAGLLAAWEAIFELPWSFKYVWNKEDLTKEKP